MTYCFASRSEHLATLIREDKCKRDIQLVNVQRMRPWSVLIGTYLSYFSPQDPGSFEKSWEKDCKSQKWWITPKECWFFRHNRVPVCINSSKRSVQVPLR